MAGHPQICLFEPEIPQNTGNIARLAAATCCRLHLIQPLGFSMSDRNLRRPGLDYWPFLDLEIHASIEPLIERLEKRVAFFSKNAETLYCKVPVDTELLVFGKETKGLPSRLREKYPGCFYKIPMFHQGVRSLNLANAVSIVLYNQLERRKLFHQ
ncbi:MAG: tRNA (cytidine(34)-2'-O)-methyltransferase [Oligoflexales bacterium]|nr:tRNA (cytidine(34)-2'-O)-methyltransferase [Oligoflexales bacterium]